MSLEKKQGMINLDFTQFCKKGNMNRVRYFLLECSVKADIRFNNQEGFNEACKKNHLEIVEFLLTSPELKKKIAMGSNSDEGFSSACTNGYLDMVKFMLISPDITAKPNPNTGLIDACRAGKLDVVKFLLTEPSLRINKEDYKRINIHYNDDNALKISVAENHLEIVDYLLSSPELNRHAHIDTNYSNTKSCLVTACELGYLEMVQFLLTSPKLQKKSDIHAYEEKALISAVNKHHYDVAKFLISYVLKDQADIYTDNSHIFKQSCYDKAYDFVQYLLYKKEMTISLQVLEDIAEKLWHVPSEHQHILQMLEKRDMYLRLNRLPDKAPTKTIKI